MVKVLIVDDELHAQESLSLLVGQVGAGKFQVISHSPSVDDAIKKIIKLKPDLVFLDIQMPEKNGIELFSVFSEPDFDVIFTTAHAEYALEAIKLRPFGYILKPICTEELKQCLENYLLHKEPKVEATSQQSDILTVQTQEQVHFIHQEDILYLSAEGSYTKIFREGQEPLLVSKHLAQLNERISEKNFIRIHSKFLVNIRKVTFWDKQKHYVHLSNGDQLSVAYRKASLLQKFLD